MRRSVGGAILSRNAVCESIAPLVAVTSSRLGHDAARHRHVCQFLCRSLLDCRGRGGLLLVASGSAIEHWATRAAELFDVPLVRLSVDPADHDADIVVQSSDTTPLSRDAVLISIADRVDAVFVRRGGKIETSLRARIADRCDASTRVAISSSSKCAAPELIHAGAIGWYHAKQTPSVLVESNDEAPREKDSSDDRWTRTDGQWLVHCTRACNGAWPGETERQYRDAILLGDDDSLRRGPLDALVRIVRSGRLLAAATATTKKHPVVCFSALPLQELLQRRCFRPQLGRWDYEPYGIALRLAVARRLGIQPVIYGEPSERSMLSAADRFRFHPIGTTYDWREEREWRGNASVDLSAIDVDDIRVFAPDTQEAQLRLQDCHWRVTYVSTTTEPTNAGVTTSENGYNRR